VETQNLRSRRKQKDPRNTFLIEMVGMENSRRICKLEGEIGSQSLVLKFKKRDKFLKGFTYFEIT
jgi:hypothetical protein